MVPRVAISRDVVYAEEVADDSDDAGRWRLESRVSGYVVMYPFGLFRLCRCSCVGDWRGGVGGRAFIREGLVDRGSP